jgi:hypothetical protein
LKHLMMMMMISAVLTVDPVQPRVSCCKGHLVG